MGHVFEASVAYLYQNNWEITPTPTTGVRESKKISNDQELTQSDPTSRPEKQTGNN